MRTQITPYLLLVQTCRRPCPGLSWWHPASPPPPRAAVTATSLNPTHGLQMKIVHLTPGTGIPVTTMRRKASFIHVTYQYVKLKYLQQRTRKKNRYIKSIHKITADTHCIVNILWQFFQKIWCYCLLIRIYCKPEPMYC